jgi:hypothetical protein
MGAVATTYTFQANDTITSTKMNDIIGGTTMTSSAIFDGTLAIASGKLKVNSQGITSNELAANAVSSIKIAAGAVTPDKLSTGGPQWGGDATNLGLGVSGTYYFQLSPTRGGDGSVVINLGAAVGNNSNASILRLGGTNGDFYISQTGSGTMIFSNPNGTPFFQGPNGFSFYKDGSNTSNFPVPAGTAPIYGARAWVNFYGIGTVGANMTVRASSNVSSVNKTATGVYRVTFTTAMPDANYAAIVGSDANAAHKIGGVITQTSGYVDIAYSQINTSSARENPDWGQVTIFR